MKRRRIATPPLRLLWGGGCVNAGALPIFLMVSGIGFDLGAEDQSKQIHQHIHALCASLCPTNQPVQVAAQHRALPIVPVHSAVLSNRTLVMRQPLIHLVTIRFLVIRIRQTIQQAHECGFRRCRLPQSLSIRSHRALPPPLPHPQVVALFFFSSVQICPHFVKRNCRCSDYRYTATCAPRAHYAHPFKRFLSKRRGISARRRRFGTLLVYAADGYEFEANLK